MGDLWKGLYRQTGISGEDQAAEAGYNGARSERRGEVMESGAFRRLIFAALGMAAVGWAALIYLVWGVYPWLWARWAFFSALVLGVAGLSTPLLALIYRRLAVGPVGERTVLREGLLVGLYVGLLAWFQLGRMVTPFLAGALGVVLALVEVGLRLWEIRRP